MNNEHEEKLRNIVARLQNGEPLPKVRRDFVRGFAGVSAEDIAAAEQRLIESGVAPKDVQRVCELHSALFNAETAEKVRNKTADINAFADGHPAKTLLLANRALAEKIDRLTAMLDDAAAVCEQFPSLLGLYAHYAIKEILFMPVLYKHGVTGPSQVMWDVDDEIKKAVKTIAKDLSADNYAERRANIEEVLGKIREMIIKEENIFLPLTLKFFTVDDWVAIYRDLLTMPPGFLPQVPRWAEGDKALAEQKTANAKIDNDGKIHLPTGELDTVQLRAILERLPVDITFIDKDDNLVFFSNPGRVFHRSTVALGNDIYNCHPTKIHPMLRQLLDDFKTKKRDSLEVWRTIQGRPISVKYMAAYDENGEYVGTVETVEDHSQALDKLTAK